MEDLYRGTADSELGTFIKGNLTPNTRQAINDFYHDGLRDSGLYRIEATEQLAQGNAGGFIDNNLRATENTFRESGQAAATFIFGKNSTAYNATRNAYHVGMDYVKDAYNYLKWW